MANKFLVPALVVTALAAVGMYGYDKLGPEPPVPLATGTIALPEISGAAVLAGEDLLVVADDAENEDDPVKKYHMVARLKEVARGIKTGGDLVVSQPMHLLPGILKKLGPKVDADSITDLEDATVGANGDIYLITSHSLNKKGKRPEKRTHLLKLRVDDISGKVTQAAIDDGSLLKHLPDDPALKSSLDRKPGDQEPGFNIEGLAPAPGGDLFAGLRSPLSGGKAVVLRLAGVDRWLAKPQAGLKITKAAELDLGGRGIRGMATAAKGGYWIIAGLSADPDDAGPANDWAIYQWDGKENAVKRYERGNRAETQTLNGPEAICEVPLTDGTGLLLISDDGAGTPSNYVVLPENLLGH